MQNEITMMTDLLDEQGRVANPGYSKHMLYHYDRGAARAHPLALKEWDFYMLRSGEWFLFMTIGHVSYAANISARLLNIYTGESHEFGRYKPLPLRSMAMPRSPEAPYTLSVTGPGYFQGYHVSRNARRLYLRAADTKLGRICVDVELRNDPENEKMVIATPFDKPNQFYLNCKENYWGAKGRATFGGRTVVFDKQSTGLLDWGRGVWPFTHQWYWGNGATYIKGKRFGFNIGWGFGDTSHATENMFFYEGKAYKLGQLQVERDETDYMRPWHFASDDGRFDFNMTPFYDNFTKTKVAFVDTRCHQVFGYFNGIAKLPNGRKIEVKDMVAFCEHARNRW